MFIMSGDRAPALVSSPSDLIEYRISDALPVDPSAKNGYQERFIHSEIYKRFPEVKSVIHSHSEAVLPYTMNGVEMRAAFHIAGFLGTVLPYIISNIQVSTDIKNRNPRPNLRHHTPIPRIRQPRHASQYLPFRLLSRLHFLLISRL